MALLVEDQLARSQESFLGRKRWHREATCPEGSLSTLVPAQGSAMPDAYKGDTGAILIGSTPVTSKVTGQARIRLTYERLDEGPDPGLSVPADWTFLERNQGYRGDRYRGLFMTEMLEVPEGLSPAAVVAAVPYGTVYPGQEGEGIWAPAMRRHSFRKAHRPGRGGLVLDFEPPSLERVLIEHTDHVLVEARSRSISYRPFLDREGRFVWHQQRGVAAADLSEKWEPVVGAGVKVRGRTLFRTRFAREYGMGGALIQYKDSVNSVLMTQYWNCPTGTLRFVDWTKYRAPTTEKLWIYDCLMEHAPEGWNEETEVQKYEYRAYQIPVRDAAGVLLDPAETREVGDWEPVGDTYCAEFYESRQWPLVLGIYDW